MAKRVINIKLDCNKYSINKTYFRPLEFDLDKIYAGLVATGGTTGILKLAAFKHKVIVDRIYEMRNNPFYQTKGGERYFLHSLIFLCTFIDFCTLIDCTLLCLISIYLFVECAIL